MREIIEPEFDLELKSFKYLGRGPRATGKKFGWSRNSKFHYRCVKCGDSMNAANNDYWNCKCGSMSLDKDAFRFGSWHGDMNILVYEKIIDRSTPIIIRLAMKLGILKRIV